MHRPSSRRRRRLSLLAILITAGMVAGCSSPDRPFLTAETLPLDTNDEGSFGNAAVGEPADDNDDSARPATGPARALITPTGVVVPVIVDLGDSYLVTTPCGERSEIIWGTPIFSIDIVLDPGHGGSRETGSVGFNDLAEKDLNLDIAKRTARLLERRGITTLLTRTSDYRIPLATRAEIGNRLEAKAIISIHHNAPNANPSRSPGTEMFIQADSDESRRLGGLLWEEIVEALDQFDVAWTSAGDAGALLVLNDEGSESYGMVRRPTIPAVLAELAYLSNPEEAELFETEEYRVAASKALADGIERWLTTEDAGSGFVAAPRIFTPNGLTGGSDDCVDPELG